MVPKLRLGTPVPEALLRVPECKAIDGEMSLGKQSFPDIHSQAELGSDTESVFLESLKPNSIRIDPSRLPRSFRKHRSPTGKEEKS
jgi:hypothetical protein